MLDVSPTQVARMESVSARLIPELTEEFRAGSIGISDAYDASTLPQEQQREVLEEYKHEGAEAIKKAKKATSSKAQPKKRTNADWIRDMSLEELARFLGVWGSGDGRGCIAVDLPEKPDPEIVAWLEQETKRNDE